MNALQFGNPGAKPSKYLLYQELVLAQSGLCGTFIDSVAFGQ